MTPELPHPLTELVHNARRITIFTGAGVSTECGIPDFRSPQGLWSRFEPIQYQDFMHSQDVRNEDWRRRFMLLDEFAGAAPGITHEAISDLMGKNPENRVITQNIDGLHQSSGVSAEQVIELHGTTSHATCQSCGKKYDNEEIRKDYEREGGVAPSCACGGHIKIAVIHFGQAMPKEPMLKAKKACEETDLFIAAGSSLVVSPASEFPAYAKYCGAQLVIINREPTPLDKHADVVLRGELNTHLNVKHWNP